MEAFIEQQRRWNRERNIIAAESRLKSIERMEKMKLQKLAGKDKNKIQKRFASGNDVLFVEGLGKSYPGKPLFKT